MASGQAKDGRTLRNCRAKFGAGERSGRKSTAEQLQDPSENPSLSKPGADIFLRGCVERVTTTGACAGVARSIGAKGRWGALK